MWGVIFVGNDIDFSCFFKFVFVAVRKIICKLV